MQMSFVLLFSLSCALAMSGCGAGKKINIDDVLSYWGTCDTTGTDENTQLNQKRHGIVNGQKLGQFNPVSSRVVALVYKNSDVQGICTGSLLPNNIVLTAAHCMPRSGNVADLEVVFTNNLGCVKTSTRAQFVRSVVAIRKNENYTDSVSDTGNDLALVQFSGSLPAEYGVFDLPAENAVLTDSDTVMMSGYGTTTYEVDDSGILRMTSMSASRVTTALFKRRTFEVDQYDTGVCSGDSGGPLIVSKEGRLQVVGVASSVKNIVGDLCSGTSYYVDVAKNSRWIRMTYGTLRFANEAGQ